MIDETGRKRDAALFSKRAGVVVAVEEISVFFGLISVLLTSRKLKRKKKKKACKGTTVYSCCSVSENRRGLGS